MTYSPGYLLADHGISIHTTAKVVTFIDPHGAQRFQISIHTTAKVVTLYLTG